MLPLTLEAPTPTNISTKSDPEIKKKGTLIKINYFSHCEYNN